MSDVDAHASYIYQEYITTTAEIKIIIQMINNSHEYQIIS